MTTRAIRRLMVAAIWLSLAELLIATLLAWETWG